eukprot:TRINITY_DN5131_c0_g1_i2.p1 TRINITY_DN5131_c0_g1~~TRINITY_DN5131_c0_g1_i2.p1  ORF type:complete len:594 (+),score=84.30 TRINITY_DN5131_c0_g1_i2:193-1974(+)
MGYSIDLFQSKEAAESYICTVCLDVVENPMFLGKCEHCLCNECLKGITNKRCPMKCKVHFQPKVPGPAFLRPYNALKLACELCSVWKGSLGDLTTHHKNECPMFPIQCSNQGCQQVRVRNKMNTIHSQLCSQRILPCLYCGDKFTFEKMRYHFVECEEYPLPCENKECTAVLPKKQLPSHKSLECLFSVVPCEWSEFGCNHKATRSDMKNHHIDSTAQHLQCVKNVLDKILTILPQDQVKHALNGLKSKNDSQQQGSSPSSSSSPIEPIDEFFPPRTSVFFAFYSPKEITDKQFLQQLPKTQSNKIKTVSLRNFEQLTDVSMIGVAQRFSQISSLSLVGCKQITDYSIASLTQNCKQLKAINLTGCIQLTDSAVASISQHCKQLEELNLSECNKITGNSAISLSQNCSRLMSLYLSECDQITDSTIDALSQHNTQFHNLAIEKCAEITDRSIISLTQKCIQLRMLNLEGCSNITDSSVTSLAQNCKQLERLFLSDCHHVTDTSIITLTQNCTKLQWLGLKGCTQITDNSILSVSQNSKRLAWFDLSGCNQVSDNALISVVKNCFDLTMLILKGCENVSKDLWDEFNTLQLSIS